MTGGGLAPNMCIYIYIDAFRYAWQVTSLCSNPVLSDKFPSVYHWYIFLANLNHINPKVVCNNMTNDMDILRISVPAVEVKWITHWSRMTHKCVNKLTITGSDNGLSPDRRQTIIWTNPGIFFIEPLGSNFSEILRNSYIFIQENPFWNVVCEMVAILSRPPCVHT